MGPRLVKFWQSVESNSICAGTAADWLLLRQLRESAWNILRGFPARGGNMYPGTGA